MEILLLLLGLGAGILTTMAGMGGGILLLLALSLILGPHKALAATAPALLLSNLHRLHLFRTALHRHTALTFAVGAVPGSLLGGLLLNRIESTWIQVAMVLSTLLAIAQRYQWFRWRPAPRWLGFAGVMIGAISATAGSAGTLVSPVLMASGLTGSSYIAGVAAAGTALHTGRILAYGVSGLFNEATLKYSVLLVGALLLGNLTGIRLRKIVSEGALGQLELGALLLSSGLACIGLI